MTALSRLAGDLAIADGGDRAAAADEARRSAYAALDHEFRRWVVLVDGEIRAIGSKDEIMPVLMQASSVCSRLADKV